MPVTKLEKKMTPTKWVAIYLSDGGIYQHEITDYVNDDFGFVNFYNKNGTGDMPVAVYNLGCVIGYVMHDEPLPEEEEEDGEVYVMTIEELQEELESLRNEETQDNV